MAARPQNWTQLESMHRSLPEPQLPGMQARNFHFSVRDRLKHHTKNWCFWTVVLEQTLESRLDSKEIQPVHSKGDQSWVFFGRTDAKAEIPVLWPPHAKSWLIGKDSDAGRDWGQENKGMTEDEMAGWHHWLDAHEFEWTLGVGDGQGGLAYCNSWGCKELDTTELRNWTSKYLINTQEDSLSLSHLGLTCDPRYFFFFFYKALSNFQNNFLIRHFVKI